MWLLEPNHMLACGFLLFLTCDKGPHCSQKPAEEDNTPSPMLPPDLQPFPLDRFSGLETLIAATSSLHPQHPISVMSVLLRTATQQSSPLNLPSLAPSSCSAFGTPFLAAIFDTCIPFDVH